MSPPSPPGEVPRLLGHLRGNRPGPTLAVVGGLHGNEPAGVRALRRVIRVLGPRREELRGDFVGLVGNRVALARGRRFLERDLNRMWTAERVGSLREPGADSADSADSAEAPEDREQRELLAALDRLEEEARGPVSVLDLHTTSGLGGPFSTVPDTLRNRALALGLPVPLILGLEELVDGTLLDYLDRRGLVTVLYEGGQHEEARAVDRCEDAVWIAVAAVGLLPESRLPRAAEARKRLSRETRRLPRVLEMRYRHAIEEGGDFRMRPGYRNFQPVAAGEVLARENGGPVRAPEDARILMPLYQEQGEDGFFMVREFRPIWLHVSALLRRLGVGRLVHWLPGVRRDPERPGVLVVDRRVARLFALHLFHLLGYRRHREEGDVLVVVRRPEERSCADATP